MTIIRTEYKIDGNLVAETKQEGHLGRITVIPYMSKSEVERRLGELDQETRGKLESTNPLQLLKEYYSLEDKTLQETQSLPDDEEMIEDIKSKRPDPTQD